MGEAHRVEVVVTGASGVPPNLLRPALRHEALRACYAEYLAQGMTAREIADALGITRGMVYTDLKTLGLSPGRNHAPKHLARTIQISAAVRKARTRARTEKVCPRCPEKGPQPLSAFASNKGTADGLRGWCRACDNAIRRERRVPSGAAVKPAVGLPKPMPALRVVGQGVVGLPKPMPVQADTAELRTTAVVCEWRLNVTRYQAQRVAVVIEPRQRRRSHNDPDWGLPEDRVATVTHMDQAELDQLAATVGVQPRPGRREPAHPRPDAADLGLPKSAAAKSA